MAFQTMFSGIWGTVAGIATVIILPGVMLWNGVDKAWDSNPQGVSDYDQFIDGATFGICPANQEGCSAKEFGNVTYDAAKNTAVATVKVGTQFAKRAAKDLEDFDPNDLDDGSCDPNTETDCLHVCNKETGKEEGRTTDWCSDHPKECEEGMDNLSNCPG